MPITEHGWTLEAVVALVISEPRALSSSREEALDEVRDGAELKGRVRPADFDRWAAVPPRSY